MKKAGKVYLAVAGSRLATQHPEIMPSERRTLLERADFDELEALIGAKPYIETVGHTVRRELEKADLYLPLDFVDTLLWDEAPLSTLDSTQRKILTRKFSDEAKGEIAYKALESVHDHWVRNNADLFFRLELHSEQFKFLRVELIGLEETMTGYNFIEPILILLCLRPEHQYLVKTYNEHRRVFRQFYGLNDENMAFTIARADYPALSGNVAAAMGDAKVAEAIAERAIVAGGKPSTW